MISIEVLATLFAVLLLIKLAFVLFAPEKWIKMTEGLLRNGAVTMIIYLVLAIIVGYYILQSLSIIQIAAVMLFTTLLFGLSFLVYPRQLIKMRKEFVRDRSKMWFPFLIWILIAIWTLLAVFL